MMRAVAFSRTEQGIAARKSLAVKPQLLQVQQVVRVVAKPVKPVLFKPNSRVSFYAIAERICTAHGFSLDDIRSVRRSERLVLARQAICYWVRRLTGYSLTQIGRLIGGRDHTTVRHAIIVYPKKRAAAGRYLPALNLRVAQCE